MPEDNRYILTCDSPNLPECCGIREVGRFSLDIVRKTRYDSWARKEIPNPFYKRASNTVKEASQELMQQVKEDNEGYPLVFNLIQNSEITEELREILQKEAQLVHTWRNLNTDNVLEMYILVNGSGVYNVDDDE